MIADPISSREEDVSSTPCIACGAHDSTHFFSIDNLPVHVGVFYEDVRSARQSPRGDVQLVYCNSCGHVFNRAFDPSKVDYRPGYEVALHHSAVFREFMESLAERLTQLHGLHRKTIVEIGSGNGWFLRLLCERGRNVGIGIDPTISQPGCMDGDRWRIQHIREYFGSQFYDRFQEWRPDIVCCLSVMEHIPSPRNLVRDLRKMLDPTGVAIYFEVFNAARAFRQKEIWSIHYEQCSYFSEASFHSLFQSNGFRVISSGGCYGQDQYLYVDGEVDGRCPMEGSAPNATAVRSATAKELPDELKVLSSYFEEQCRFWQAKFDEFRSQNKSVVFWGTGGKGVTFLNRSSIASLIDYAVDINPDKHGKFVPGSGQQIVPPSYLTTIKPDIIIISNALYEQEIKQQVAELGLQCDCYVA